MSRRSSEDFRKNTKGSFADPEKAVRALAILDRAWSGAIYAGIEVVAIKLILDHTRGEEALAVITGFDDAGAPVVAFHSSTAVPDLLIGLASRLENGSLKWKADEYRKGAETS